jgi:hypothetical protein
MRQSAPAPVNRLMRPLGKLFLILFASLPVASCSSTSNDSGPTPTAKCQSFIDAYCTRVVECKVLSATVSECTTALKSQVPCEKAVSVTSNFDPCMATINGSPCDKVKIELPDICKGVVLVP